MVLSPNALPLPRLRPLLPLLLAALPLAAAAAEAEAPTTKPASSQKDGRTLGEIVVSSTRLDDTEQRRFATAAKMVFGREELDRYGDSSVGDVLKRLPASPCPAPRAVAATSACGAWATATP